MKKPQPVIPGVILLEAWLKPMNISQYRLARFFGTDAQSWLNLQSHYDMERTALETGTWKKLGLGRSGLWRDMRGTVVFPQVSPWRPCFRYFRPDFDF